jgi:hypothetical protein
MVQSRLSGRILEGRAASRALAGIVIVAVAVRVVSALHHGDTVTSLPGIDDQLSYDALARQVLAGHGFTMPADWWPATSAGAPTAHWSYLYTLYLAAVYAVVGPHPLAARLIQVVIAGILHPWLAWRIGCRVFGAQVSLAAAGLTAVYGYFVYYAGALVTETFFILAVLWVLDLATGMVRGREGRSPDSGRQVIPGTAKPWLLLGLALGLAAMLRQVILLFAPVLFMWLLWTLSRQQTADQAGVRVSRRPSVVGGLLVTVIVVTAMIAPWTVRNYAAFGRFVPLNTNAGYTFFWANHPMHGTDFVAILPSDAYQKLIPAELHELDEAALDAALLGRGIGFVVEDPLRYARLCLSRVKDYFKFWPAAESSFTSNSVRTLSFGVMLPFMLYGLLLSGIRSWRCMVGGKQSATVLLYLFAAAYSLIHLLSWAMIRYRLPVDAVLILFAALAVTDLVTRATRERIFASAQYILSGSGSSKRSRRQSSSPNA